MGNYTEADQIRVFLGCVSPSAEVYFFLFSFQTKKNEKR